MLSKAALCAFANVALAQDPLKPTPKPAVNYMMKWEHFKQEYGKTYSSPVEEEQRFQVFKVNVDFIYMVNSRQNGYELGVTAFADMTADEFGSTHFGLKQPEEPWGSLPHLGTHEYAGEALADSVDWTTKGAVTPVKNQGQCGSCWSFSTTGSLEGAWKLAGNPLTSLSEQQFVDCDKVDSGCSGGLMDNAFKFAEKNAICTEESYPYKGKGGSCKASSCTKGLPEGKVTGFKDVPSDSEQAMMSAIQQQPVSIAIEADKSVFQLYKSGVLEGACGSNLDHGVLTVGYGTDNGKDYWLVKNSWGATWGDKGFVKLLRGKGGAGECGLLKQASYPVVGGSGPSPPAPPSPPSPPSPPAPPSPPSPPGSTHYEKPPCRSDEVDVQVQGLTGSTCSPKCSGTTCPTDVPAGTTAKPQCVLQDSSSGDKYCALTCFLGGCPAGSKCQHSGLVGLCMYDDSGADERKTFEVVTENLITV